jgi:Heterokaryon incompatibility protein (HET)
LRPSVRVDGHLFPIRVNLKKALRRIRSETESRVFWIDSICINQLSLEERSQQVKIMGLIYKTTRECIIWLGEVDDDPIQPYKKLEAYNPVDVSVLEGHIRDKKLESPKPLQNAGKTTESLDIPGAFEVADLLARNIHFYEMPFYRILQDGKFELREEFSKAVYALENILQRSWWKRIWTAQEAFLPNNSVIHVGPYSMPYQTFLEASDVWGDHIRSFSHNRWENCCASILHLWLGHSSSEEPEALFEPIEELQTLKIARADHKSGSVAHNLFLLSVQRSATIPHDRVYGLFGLIQEFFELDEAPDYTLALLQLYKRTTIKFMKEAQHLCLLSYAHPQIREGVEDEDKKEYFKELPSWCPDWNSVALRDYFDIYNHGGFIADKEQTYDAASKSDAVLNLHAVLIGVIPKVGQKIPSMQVPPGKFVPAVQDWVDIAAGKGLTPMALWEIIHVATHKDVGLQTLGDQDAWWEVLKELAARDASFQEMVDASKGNTYEHYRMSMTALENRGVFSIDSTVEPPAGLHISEELTEYRKTLPQGSIGLTTPNVLEGDCIFLAQGARTPLILRPIKGEFLSEKATKEGLTKEQLSKSFTLVGVCYIHGMMQGQAWPENPIYDQIYLL